MPTLQEAPANGQFPAPIALAVKQAVEVVLAPICGQTPTWRGETDEAAPCSGVLGTISFLGEPSWTFSLMLPEATAPQLVEKFAGFAIPFDSPDMGDVVGELANVLAGDIVSRCEQVRIKAQMSLPLVARGHDIEMISPSGQPIVRLICEVPQGSFWVKLAVAKKGMLPGRRPGT